MGGHNGVVRAEYRLTAHGHLLDPETTPVGEFAQATRRWVVATLTGDRADRIDQQVTAMQSCDLIPAGADVPTRALAEAALADPGTSTLVPDDVIALRVPLVSLTLAQDSPIAVTMVHVVARTDRAVTTSTDAAALERLVNRVRDLPLSRRRGAFVVVRSLLGLALEDAFTVSDLMTTRVAELEDLVFSSTISDETVVEEIYRAKRALAELRRVLIPVINRLALVTEVDDAELGEEAAAHLERQEQGYRRVVSNLDSDDRLLGDVLTAQLTLVQVQQNTDMRRISAYAALITVPTLIAGIYGMNFTHMPELTQVWGYPAALVLMVVTVLALRQAFRRSGWL